MSKICPVCGLPEEVCICEEIAREQQLIRIFCDKRRYGKIVTVVEGIDAGDIDMDELKQTYLKRFKDVELTSKDYKYLCEELNLHTEEVKDLMK